MPKTVNVRECGEQKARLCVVLAYHVHTGDAVVNFRGFTGNATLRQGEILRSGWTELAFGNFLVCDIKQHGDRAFAVNPREAKYPEDWNEQ